MKAVYKRRDILCVVIRIDAYGVLLEPVDGDTDRRFWVTFDDPNLIVDPTDDDVKHTGVV